MLRINQPKTLSRILGYFNGPLHLRDHGKAITIKKPQPIVESGKIVYVIEKPTNNDGSHTHRPLYPVTDTTIAQTSNNRFLWLQPKVLDIKEYGIMLHSGHISNAYRGATAINDLSCPGQGFINVCNVGSNGYESITHDGTPVFHFWKDWLSASYVMQSQYGPVQFAINDTQSQVQEQIIHAVSLISTTDNSSMAK